MRPRTARHKGTVKLGKINGHRALAVRSTGIGCYFDDTFHELLGQASDEFQDLYHFTVGGPVEDHRLITLPPYAHLPARDQTGV